MTFSGTTQTDYMKLVSVPDNLKAGLINYAGTDFLTIRQDLVNYIKSVYPLDYNNFSESDLGMMLVELVAYMGASFSLKGDMLANENFIRTVKTRRNLQKLLELIGVSMRGPLAAAAGASLVTQETLTAASFPLTVRGASRVVSIPSKEDGALVNYTLYKVANNTIQGLTDIASTLLLEGDESSTPDTSASFTNLALIEGALTTQKGRFTADEGNKTVVLTDSPIIDGSVQVYVQAGVDNPATGAYNQVNRIYSASGVTDRVFQMLYDEG